MSLRFCSECGSPLQGEDVFCGNCGHRFESKLTEDVQQTKEIRHAEQPQHIEVPAAQKKSGMTKKQKIVAGVLAVIALALFSAHTYIKSIVSPEDQIILLHEAFHEGNSEKLFEVIHVDEGVIYDSENYMELLKRDGFSMVDEIVTAIQLAEQTRLPQFITSHAAGDVLKVEREKYLGIYYKFKITALAYEAKLDTELPKGEVTIGEKKWELKGEPIVLGHFLPSGYTISLSNEELNDSTLERNVFITSEASDNVIVLEKDYYMITLAEENLDSLLVIDGEETDKKVSEMLEIGPLFSEEPIELSIVNEVDGEQQKSTVVRAYPGDEVSFTFDQVATASNDSDEVLTEGEITEVAEQFVLNFRSAYEDALNKRDFSLIEPYLLTDSVAYKELVEFVGELKDENYTYDFTLNEATDSLLYSRSEVIVDTYEVFDFINHKGHLTHYKREKTYNLELDIDGDLKIYNIAIRDTVRE